MKSKTSCFNKTIFNKNITMFWPFWVIMILTWFYAPFSLWMGFYREKLWSGGDILPEDLFYHYVSVFGDMRLFVIICFFSAIISVLLCFNYLFHARSCNMIHAFPITRKQLFCTNLLAALIMQVVPIFIASIASIILCLSYGLTCVEWIALWFVLLVAVTLIATAMATVCVMISGQLYVVPVFYFVMNFLVVGIRFLVGHVLAAFAWGMDYSDFISNQSKLVYFSPMYLLVRTLMIDFSYFTDDITGKIKGFACDYYPGKEMMAYAILALVLFFVAYKLYCGKKLELAGDILTIPILKPLLRGGTGICGGFLIALLCYEMVDFFAEINRKLYYGALFFICAIVLFLLSEMLIQKNFRIFNKKLWRELAIFAILLVVTYSGLYFIAFNKEAKTPAEEEIAEAYVNIRGYVNYSGENCLKALEYQRFILNHKRDVIYSTAKGEQQVATISFRYKLKNDKIYHRTYDVVVNDITEEMFQEIEAKEMEVDNTLKNLFCLNYAEATVTGGTIEQIADRYSGQYMDQADAQRLFEAIRQDAEDGTIQIYNGSYLFVEEADCYSSLNIELRFHNTDALFTPDYYVESVKYYAPGNMNSTVSDSFFSSYINFGPKCKHLVAALIELGYIESEEELLIDGIEYK